MFSFSDLLFGFFGGCSSPRSGRLAPLPGGGRLGVALCSGSGRFSLAAFVAARLRGAGFPVFCCAGSGVVAVVSWSRPSSRVAVVRAARSLLPSGVPLRLGRVWPRLEVR